MDRLVQIMGPASSEVQSLFSFLQDLGFSVELNPVASAVNPCLLFVFDSVANSFSYAPGSSLAEIPCVFVHKASEPPVLALEGYSDVLEYPWDWTAVAVIMQRLMPLDSGIQSECRIGDWIDFSLVSGRSIFQSMRQFLRVLLAQTALPRESLHSIHYAICEILLNAMEHGNGFDPHKRVLGSYVLFADRLVVKIEDQGCGFLLSDIPNPIQQPLAVAEQRKSQGKRPGGYGLALAQKWMDLSYSERGNTVLLTKTF